MHRTGLLAAALAVLIALGAAQPRPAAAVDLALVLLNDVSKSMDEAEFAMVKAGYKAAFADPDVIRAIAANGRGVAIAYVEFSGEQEIVMVQGWDILTDPGSVRAFGEAVVEAPRSSTGNTALAAGLRQATKLLENSDFTAARQVIDVASDHPHDGGRSGPVRDAAVAAGITINALPIIDNRQIGTFDGRMGYSTAEWGAGGIAGFYSTYVVGGLGSFVVEANDYAAFGEALKRKLLLELIASNNQEAFNARR